MSDNDENKRPKVGVGVLVFKDGKLLMGRRIGEHGKDTWSPQGGHLEFGETWEACARREVMEETGIMLKNVQFITVTNDIFKDTGKHYVTIWIKAEWESGEPHITEPDIYVDLRWFNLENLPTPLFLPFQNLNKRLFN